MGGLSHLEQEQRSGWGQGQRGGRSKEERWKGKLWSGCKMDEKKIRKKTERQIWPHLFLWYERSLCLELLTDKRRQQRKCMYINFGILLPEGGKKSSSSLPQNSLKRLFVKQYEILLPSSGQLYFYFFYYCKLRPSRNTCKIISWRVLIFMLQNNSILMNKSIDIKYLFY